MKYGLTDVEIDFLQINLINPLKKNKARVFLFGSRATNKHQRFSDIDLLFIPDQNSPIPGHVTHLLLSKIEESRFPYKIDLVNYYELAASYKENIEKEKIEL